MAAVPRSGATSARNAASSPRRAASISSRSVIDRPAPRATSARDRRAGARQDRSERMPRVCRAAQLLDVGARRSQPLRAAAVPLGAGDHQDGRRGRAGDGRRARRVVARCVPASARISTWRRSGGQPRSQARSASAAAAAAPAPRPATTSRPGSAPSSSPWSAAHTSAASARSSAPGRRGAHGTQSTTAPTREQSSWPSASSAPSTPSAGAASGRKTTSGGADPDPGERGQRTRTGMLAGRAAQPQICDAAHADGAFDRLHGVDRAARPRAAPVRSRMAVLHNSA